MIRFLERSEIDDRAWDECIQRSFNGNLYGNAWFLDIVAERWGALVENEYERVFPMAYRKKLGISYVYQPFFTQQLGLFSTTALHPGILARFTEAIPERFRHIELNLNTHNNLEDGLFGAVPQLNHELDLINDHARIRQGYSENLVRNLKKAEKAGLSVSQNVQPEQVIALFRQNRGKEIRHLGDEDYMKLKRMIFTGIYKGLASVWGVYDARNQLCAGAFFLRSNNKAIFLFSGLSPEGRESGAMPFIIDAYIRHHCGRHLTFDFDGSNDPNLARFYKSFGARECTYPRININRLPALISPALSLYFRLRRK